MKSSIINKIILIVTIITVINIQYCFAQEIIKPQTIPFILNNLNYDLFDSEEVWFCIEDDILKTIKPFDNKYILTIYKLKYNKNNLNVIINNIDNEQLINHLITLLQKSTIIIDKRGLKLNDTTFIYTPFGDTSSIAVYENGKLIVQKLFLNNVCEIYISKLFLININTNILRIGN